MSLGDLKRQIADKKVILFIGTGVSISVSDNNPIANWKGLLKSGVEKCNELCTGLRIGWKENVLEQIDSNDMDELLAAAEQIKSKLTNLGGQYKRWLRETVGELTIVKPEVLNVIKSLNLPIVTTNYDDLLEKGLNLHTITWTHTSEIDRFIRGEEQGVFHLHGHWQDPNSIILGIRDYHTITNFQLIQSFMQALRLGRNIVFIGFGAGLQDPNFKAFLEFGRTILFDSESRHYRLIKDDEIAGFSNIHPNGSGIYPISYGASHDDLIPFLQSLIPISNP